MHDSKPTYRPRISLRTLLLLMAIFAMGITIWQLRADLEPLRTEVRRLRDETGQLTIEDSERIHAIQMITDYPLTWKWRVYIPAGRKVRLMHQNHHISKDGLPKANLNSGRLLIGPKEFVVTVKIDKQSDGQWRSGVSFDGVTTYRLFRQGVIRWLNKGEWGSLIKQVDRNVSVEQFGDPLVLLRKRVFYNRQGGMPPANAPAETDGLLIWLAE